MISCKEGSLSKTLLNTSTEHNENAESFLQKDVLDSSIAYVFTCNVFYVLVSNNMHVWFMGYGSNNGMVGTEI